MTRIKEHKREVNTDFVNGLLGEPLEVTYANWDMSQNLFAKLRRMASPKHNWVVIHAMSLIYLGLIFPGWYLLARARMDYRTTTLAFLGVTLLFTIAFHVVGRRGYGETTTVNSVALARPVGEKAFRRPAMDGCIRDGW